MNLVIDDAVEVKQATKTDEEQRRHLGMGASLEANMNRDYAKLLHRPDTLERRQRIFDSVSIRI